MDGVGVAGPSAARGAGGGAGSGTDAAVGGPSAARPIFLIGLTNRPELVDAALLRPGRLEQLLHVPFPDAAEREGVLRVHTRRLALAEDVSLAHVAQGAERFSGAALAALAREATLQALARQMSRSATEAQSDDDEEDEDEDDEEEAVMGAEPMAAAAGDDATVTVCAADFAKAARLVRRSQVLAPEDHAKLVERDVAFREARDAKR